RRDLLHRRGGEAAFGEQFPTDREKLFPALLAGHALLFAGSGILFAHGFHDDRSGQAATRLAASRSGSGQRTLVAHPSFSKTQMVRAEMSICPLSTPCRAQVGSAWCRLCQDSPKDGIASHHTLRERSRTAKFSSPMV